MAITLSTGLKYNSVKINIYLYFKLTTYKIFFLSKHFNMMYMIQPTQKEHIIIYNFKELGLKKNINFEHF